MNKNKIYTLIFVILSILIIIFLVIFNAKHTVNLKVKYIDGKNIVYDNFNKSFKDTKTIKIVNNTKDIQVYSIRWSSVDNTLKEQNKFLYKVKCEGDRCPNTSPSQVPLADFDLFTDLYLDSFEHQTFTITFTYSGKKDKTAHFKGSLIVREGIADLQN